MTIYVITEGCYSDYHIITATIDKDKAYKLAALIGNAEVEEYDSEEYNFIDNRKVFKVTNNTERVAWDNLNWWSCGTTVLAAEEDHSAFGYEQSSYGPCLGYKDKFITSYVRATNAEHALKICYDFIAQKKAEKAGL